MKNAATGIGLAVLGLGIAVNGLNLNGNQANATPAPLKAGPEDPVIVWFNVTDGVGNRTMAWRLWSDGRLEHRYLGSNYSCGSGWIDRCDNWLEVPAATNDGFACRGDINGDRNVDSADLGILIAQWGQELSCDPQPSYPCFDLNGLNMNIAAR